MKRLLSATALLFSLWTPAHAAYIVNTSAPTGSPSWSFSAWQYFAGEFAVNQSYVINSIEAYFSNSSSTGSVDFAIHSDNGNVPGSILYTTSQTYGAQPLGWHGVTGLGWTLGPGTYWVSFKPDANINGSMPGTAPNPLDEYAQAGGDYGWQDQGANFFDYLDIGVRIDATTLINVPEPATTALLGLGLIGFAAVRRRKQ